MQHAHYRHTIKADKTNCIVVLSQTSHVSRANFLPPQREICAREMRRVQVQMMPWIFQQNKPFYLLPRTANLLPLKTVQAIRVKKSRRRRSEKKHKIS